MNIKKIITVGVAGMAMGAMALDNVEVTDVKARQRYPWNGKVDIDFTLDSKATEPYQMQVEVYDNVGKTNLPVKSVCTEGVSAEANPCMVRTDTSRIVWDAAKDLPNGFKCTNVLVTCRDARLLSVSNLYCVIDLQTGEKEYLSGVPKGGWTDDHKTTKIVFRRIEAGSFMMGSPASEIGRSANETQHKVTITKPYYIAIFELTEAQYAQIMGVDASSSKLPKLLRYGEVRGHDWVGTWGYGYNTWTITQFCWPEYDAIDAQSIVGRLRTLASIPTLDLPTEAQWEMAARASAITGICNGFEATRESICNVGRYAGNNTDGRGDTSCLTYTHVGCYEANAYGLYDVHGNVQEWCLDAWIDDLGTSDSIDPTGNRAHVSEQVHYEESCGSLQASVRVVKGGGYYKRWWNYNHGAGSEVKIAPEVTSLRLAAREKGYSAKQNGSEYCVEYTMEGARLIFLAE